MLQLAQRTEAPRSRSVSMSTAVSTVICSEPVMRIPRRGFSGAYLRRIDIKPGISCSATWMALRPHSARLRSLTLKSCEGLPLAALTGGFATFARAGGSLTGGMFVKCIESWLAELFHRALERRGLVGSFPGDAVEIVHFAEVTVIRCLR